MRRPAAGHQPDMEMNEHQYIVAIDCETGGLDPAKHALLQLAAVPTWEAEPFCVWIWPEPGTIVDAEAAEKNGYLPGKWLERGAVTLYTALDEFDRWLSAAPVPAKKLGSLAHNAGFDRAFLEAAFRHVGNPCPLAYRWRCTQAAMLFAMDAGVIPYGFTSLDALGTLCGLERTGEEHDALKDARICLAGYHHLIKLTQSTQ